ncbi:MAG: host attachment protein [Caulobacterales bacterium]
MPKSPKTRFLIASGARARWVEHMPDLPDPVTIGELKPRFSHQPKGPVQVSFESASRMRNGPERSGEAARRLADFAAQIADEVNREEAAGEFERLALVAPPRLLKAIRERLSHAARTKVCMELPRDLTKHPNHELHTWLHAPGLL